jgi:hypothetical protein
MQRPWSIVLGLLVLSSVVNAAEGGRPVPEVRIVPLTRVVRIPVSSIGAQGPGEAPPGDGVSLLEWPGAEDARTEGPDGFDVLDDGSFLISNPLRKSISVFDFEGKFRESWKIGFAADSVTAVGGMVLVREAFTGQYHAFDRKGTPLPNGNVTLPPAPKAWIDKGGKSGSVALSEIKGSNNSTLQVRLDQPGSTLLSLESLATDESGNTYVALETTVGDPSSDAIDLLKYVRKYSADGRIICETASIPLDYYIVPVDELRVHQGVVYQLMTTSSEVQINIWKMN